MNADIWNRHLLLMMITILIACVIGLCIYDLDHRIHYRTIVRHVTETQQTYLQQQESSALNNCAQMAFNSDNATVYAACVKEIVATFH
jgi:hypothetical protein